MSTPPPTSTNTIRIVLNVLPSQAVPDLGLSLSWVKFSFRTGRCGIQTPKPHPSDPGRTICRYVDDYARVGCTGRATLCGCRSQVKAGTRRRSLSGSNKAYKKCDEVISMVARDAIPRDTVMAVAQSVRLTVEVSSQACTVLGKRRPAWGKARAPGFY